VWLLPSQIPCKNDRQAEICYGNSLIPHSEQSRESGDQLAGAQHKFDFMLSNPPFSVTWGGKDGYEKEARKYQTSRYQAGMPRTNDGALLFLQTMLAKMKPASQAGSRIAIIFNGSPLSNGDCGSGESEIRRWILENDWLDAIVMLPDQMFYNTGIYTYIWLLSNNKPALRKQQVKIIDARKQFDKEPKSFGNKRNRILDRHRQWIGELYRSNGTDDQHNDHVKIFKNKDFAFHKVSVVFWQTDENDQTAYITEQYAKAFTPANIKKEQQFYESDLDFRIRLKLDTVDREISFTLGQEESFVKIFEKEVKDAFAGEIAELTEKNETPKEKNKAVNAFIKGLEVAAEFTHRHYVSDNEYIQYGEDIEEFLKREIAKPIIRWQDSPHLGYEILPNKYFYKYQPPRPVDELLKEFWALEKEAEKMLTGLGISH